MSSAKNFTIDDSQWATPALHLSPGWNMLRVNGSDQYINDTQVDSVRPLLGEFWNGSLSWTTTAGSNTTIFFVGTDIWAYGIAGEGQGSYTATLDNITIGQYTANARATDYHKLLFAAHGLRDGPLHYLTLSNIDDGSSLAFDVAIINSAAAFNSPTKPVASASSSPSTSFRPVASTSIPADPQLLPTQYSAAQLASLAEPYHFHWNAAIVFVVIISCLITAISSIFALHFISRIWINKRRKVDVGIGQSYLIEREGLKKSRPTRRTIDALRGEKIASPMPSSGAHSGGFNRSSDGTGEFSGSGREYEVNHGC